MNDQERYTRDKAAVMAMIRFILIVAIACVFIYFSTKIILILIPFLIGFLLAKTSYILAGPLSKLSKRRKGLTAEDLKHAKTQTSSSKDTGYLARVFHPRGKKQRKPLRTNIAIVIYVILLILIAFLCVLGINQIIYQANNAFQRVSAFASGFSGDSFDVSVLDRFSTDNGGIINPAALEILKENFYDIGESITAKIPDILASAMSATWNIIGSVPYGVFVVICVILSGYYFISDGPTVMKSYLKNTPNKIFKRKSVTLINDLSVTLFRVLGGYISLLIITFVEAFILFKIAGVDYAIILALVTGVIDFLPVLGISATMIPVMIYCAMHGNFTSVIILIIGMALMTVIRRIIEPIILGKSMRIHPLLMLIGMVAGVYIWGPIGFLVGPMVLIIIIQVINVFEIDKKFTSFMSRVLKKFVAQPEDTSHDAE